MKDSDRTTELLTQVYKRRARVNAKIRRLRDDRVRLKAWASDLERQLATQLREEAYNDSPR